MGEMGTVHEWLMGIGMVLGVAEIVVNLAALLTIIRNSFLWTTSNIYIASLATSDMLMGCLLVLMGAKVIPGYTEVVFTLPPVCLSLMLLASASTLASILTFAVVSVDRYFSIGYPFLYNSRATVKVVISLVLVVWFVAFVLGGMMIYFKFKSASFIPLCVWNYPIESELYILCSTTYLCIVISGVMYTLVSRLALNHLRSILAQSRASAWEHSIQPMRETFRQKLRAFKMFVVVLGAFCVFWGPYLGVVAVHHLVRPQSISVLDFTFLLGLLNSLGNVFIYMIFNAEFRMAYKRFFRGNLVSFVGETT